jgi:predicted AlkP superfamily phosphohydrolase/phosphomutase
LKLKTGGKNFAKFLSYKTGFSPLKLSKIVYKFGLEKLIKKDKESFGKTASKIGFSYKDIDFQKTKAFGFGYYGFIFVNDKTRFDFGSVELKEKDRVVREIIEALKEMGEKFDIKVNVWEREEIYKGPNVEKLPDIIYSLDSFSYVSSWVPFPDFNFFGPSMTEKTGDHDTQGILIISQKGRKVNLKDKKKANITDILPTVLDFMKVNKPEDLDGESLLD